MSRFVVRLAQLLFLLLAGTVLVSSATAQAPARTVDGTVSLDPNGEVEIDNHEGSITVTTWNRDEVRYEAEIMPTDEDPDAENVAIRVREQGNRLRLATEHDEGDDESKIFGFGEDGWQWGGINIPDVHYTVTMPATADLVVDDHESRIDVSGVRGEAQVDTHEGPISIEDQHGDVIVDSHESRMDLGRVVGNIKVDTHEGVLTVDELDGGLRVDTHDGEVDVTFASLTDDVSIETHDGDATLSLPAGTGFDINTDFDDDDADLRSDFDLDAVRVADDDDEDEINYRGDVNGGGPEIYFDSHDGDFVLRSH